MLLPPLLRPVPLVVLTISLPNLVLRFVPGFCPRGISVRVYQPISSRQPIALSNHLLNPIFPLIHLFPPITFSPFPYPRPELREGCESTYHTQQPPSRITRLRPNTNPIPRPTYIKLDVFPWPAVRVSWSGGLRDRVVSSKNFERKRIARRPIHALSASCSIRVRVWPCNWCSGRASRESWETEGG